MSTKIFEMLIRRHWWNKVVCTHSHKTAAFGTIKIYSYTKTSVIVSTAQFCNWFCEAVCNGEVDPLLNCCTNEITYRISRPIRCTFFPKKCDLNSTCVLCTEGKYYFQTYKYLYIYYTTSLSWDSEIFFQIMRSGITACERLSFLSGDTLHHVIPGIYAAAVAKCSQV